MTTYNTGNPVPSIDPRDLDDNAQAFDRFLMSLAASEPDRLGMLRKTWHQMELDAAALVSPNVAALAALTGSADKLPYFTGAGALSLATLTAFSRTLTAAANAAAARLVLGTAAETLTQIQSFGWGLAIGQPAVTATDANACVVPQMYSLSSGASNIPAAAAGTLLVFKGLAGAITQVWNTNGSGDWQVRSSANSGSTWTIWSSKASAGANANITSLSGLTTALSVAQGGTGVTSDALHLANLIIAGAYAKSNILGTVSQVSSVPTGAILETGGTLAGTGKYFKYADGRVTIVKTLAIATGSTTAKGTLFGSAAMSAGTFPFNFVGDLPVVQATGTDSGGGGWAATEVLPGLGTWGSYSTRNHVSSGTSGTIQLTADGRWF